MLICNLIHDIQSIGELPEVVKYSKGASYIFEDRRTQEVIPKETALEKLSSQFLDLPSKTFPELIIF